MQLIRWFWLTLLGLVCAVPEDSSQPFTWKSPQEEEVERAVEEKHKAALYLADEQKADEKAQKVRDAADKTWSQELQKEKIAQVSEDFQDAKADLDMVRHSKKTEEVKEEKGNLRLGAQAAVQAEMEHASVATRERLQAAEERIERAKKEREEASKEAGSVRANIYKAAKEKAVANLRYSKAEARQDAAEERTEEADARRIAGARVREMNHMPVVKRLESAKDVAQEQRETADVRSEEALAFAKADLRVEASARSGVALLAKHSKTSL